jgi:hypothetical protein
MVSQSSIHQTLLSWNCCAQQQFPRLILTPLPRTRDSSTTPTWVPLRLITCHILARMPTIMAYQFHPSLRAPCPTILHPRPPPRRRRRRQMIKPLPRRVTTSPTFLLRRLLGLSRAGTSPPVVTVLLASSPILRARIILVPCPRLLSILPPTNNRLTLPTFIPSPHRRPSFNNRMAYPLPTIFPLSPHSRRRSPSHRRLRNSCTSVTLRRLCLLCRSPSVPQEHPYQHQDLTAPCPLSLLHTPTLANILSPSLSLLRPLRMALLQDHSRPPRLTRNLRLHRSCISVFLHHLSKMAHKNRLRKRASGRVVIVVQVGAQVFAVRHLAVVASRRACSSPLAAAGMGAYIEFPCTLAWRWTYFCRDDCRFPHVLADGHVVGRGGRFRPPPQNPMNGNNHNQANLEEKLANLSITEVGQFTALFHRAFHVTFRPTFFFLCASRTAIMPHAKEAVAVRPLPNVVRAVLMVCTRGPQSRRPPRRNSACPTQMNSRSSVARPLHLKSTGTPLIRGQRLRRCYKHPWCARIRQSWKLPRLKHRNNSDPLLVRCVVAPVRVLRIH